MKTTTAANDTTRTHGSKYVSGQDLANVAKLIRKDVAAAVKNGDLPKWLKASVKISRYSMGQSLSLKVTALPGICFLSTKAIRFEQANPNVYCDISRYSEVGMSILTTLREIVADYNRDNSDLMNDYHSVDFYEHVDFAGSLERALREEIIAAVRAVA